MQHIDVLGICISMCMLSDWWRVFVHISVGFGIACSVQRQYQSLEMRNGNSAVPLFLYPIL